MEPCSNPGLTTKSMLFQPGDQEKALDFTQAFLHGHFDDIMPVTLRGHSSVPDTLPTPPITELYPTL